MLTVLVFTNSVSLSNTQRREGPGMKKRVHRETNWLSHGHSRPGITREKVTREAIAILDRHGISGLTMRDLARRLKVKAASLYNHVHDKQDLLTLVADSICADLQINAVRGWREFLKETAIQFRKVLLSHRDAAQIMAATAPVGPNRLRLIESVLCSLIRAGFTPVDAIDAASVQNSFVVGFVLDETLGNAEIPEGGRSIKQKPNWLKSLPPDRFPTISALAHELADTGSDRRFAFGIHALLDGFEVKLHMKKRGASRRKAGLPSAATPFRGQLR